MVASLRQARHSFELQDQAQGNNGIFDIATASSRIHLGRHMLPSLPLPALGWQMPFHQLPYVAERGQGHYGWDFQGPGQRPFPVRTGQG